MPDLPVRCWQEVGFPEFQQYVRDYPRVLRIDPPLSRKARLRVWSDLTLGPWPDDAVAKSLDVHRQTSLRQAVERLGVGGAFS
jgi:hypothetical protein